MKMTRWIGLGLMLSAVSVLAQEPPAAAPPERPRPGMREGMPPRGPMTGGDMEGLLMRLLSPDSPIAKEIGLTEEQSRQLKDLVPNARKDMEECREKLQKMAEEQAALLSQDAPDEAAVMKAVDQLGQMRTEIAKKTMQQVLAAQKILTPEQRAKLRDRMKERGDMYRERLRERRGMGEAGSRGPRREGVAPPAAPPKAP